MGKGEACSQTPGRARLRQPESRRDMAWALAPSQSNRFVSKPVAFTLGHLNELRCLRCVWRVSMLR